MFGSAPSQFKRICWKRKIQVPAFGVLDWKSTGVKGNGFNAYIDTAYNPATATGMFTQNNAGIMLYVTERSTVGFAFGNESIRLNDQYIRLNDMSSFSTPNISTGLNQIVRTGTNAKQFISEEGSQTFSHVSTALESNNIYLLGTNNAGVVENLSDVNISFFTIGAPKTEEHSAISKLLKVAVG